MLKDNRLYSVVFNKCPRCHQGDFFITSSAYSRRFDEMHETCSHCGETLIPEPGFYWGSMFVSYAFYTIYTLFTFLVFVTWLKIDLDYYLIGLVRTFSGWRAVRGSLFSLRTIHKKTGNQAGNR
jgi:uncharacterized protein (DUF983 family)